MTELYARVLLWHKLVAMVTGGLALCSARHRLSRDEAQGWSRSLRNVADEIDSVVAGGPFILDDKGQRVVKSTDRAALAGTNGLEGDELPPPRTATGGGVRVARRKL